MRYLKLYESFEDIIYLCKIYNIKDYTINPDGSIDSNDYVFLYHCNLIKLPLKFNKVDGYFDCANNKLTSLEGSPVEINGGFLCYKNELTSFKDAPKNIRGQFDCEDNNINSFEYFPMYVNGSFLCYNNPIYWVWMLFTDTTKIELLNDFDMFRDEDTDTPIIIMDRLNDFLVTIGKKEVGYIKKYKNI